MRADPRFVQQGSVFWAYVRAITEALGSARRGSDRVAAYSVDEMVAALKALGRPADVLGASAAPSEIGALLRDYFAYRAALLNDSVRLDLMVTEQARDLYAEVRRSVGASTPQPVLDRTGKMVAEIVTVAGAAVRVPMNKQTADKRAPSYLTGITNVLIAHELGGRACDYDPQRIPVIDHDGLLYAALSRRMDGSYPSTVNPVAMWEIKEYYYTTTFGSKISDGVYITALDGYERRDVEKATGTTIEHLIIADAYDTWWCKGKSYLCRFVDLLHMGLVTEVLFGREVVRRIPDIVPAWLAKGDPDERVSEALDGAVEPVISA